jgi:hypothetical protein
MIDFIRRGVGLLSEFLLLREIVGRKTDLSTFVNFIHQRDAHIAMSVVEHMHFIKAPIYTVHDNFITTALYSEIIPYSYTSAFCKMGGRALHFQSSTSSSI